MNLNTRDLHVAICRLLTCAPPTPCPREEDCTMVAMALRRLLPDPIPDEPKDPGCRGELCAGLEWGMIVIDTKECHQCQHYQRTRKGPHYWDLDCAMKQREFETGDADSCGMYSEDPQPPADSVGFPYGDQE